MNRLLYDIYWGGRWGKAQGGAAAPAVATATFRDSASSTADASSYSGGVFDGLDCGDAVAGRRIVVGVTVRAAGTTLDISAVTVNGNGATEVRKARQNTGNTTVAALYEIVEATGTTCNVAVTLNESASRCGVVVFDVVGAGGASTVGDVSVANDPTATISPPASGCTIVFAACAGATTATPTNYTEGVDAQIEAALTMTGGVNNTASGSTVFTVDFAAPTATTSAGAFAAWGP